MIGIKEVTVSIILTLVFSGLQAQQRPRTKAPSPNLYHQLQDDLKKISDPDSIADRYTEYAIRLHRPFPDTVLSVIEKIDAIPNLENDKKTAFVNLLTGYYLSRSRPDSALKRIESARETFSRLQNKRRLLSVLNFEAQINSRLNNYLRTEEIYLKAIEISDENNFDAKLSMDALAKLYMRVGATEIAISRYQQMLEIEESFVEECRVKLNISNAYKVNQDFEKASSILLPCLESSEIDERTKVVLLRSLSDLAKVSGQKTQRFRYISEAMELQKNSRVQDPITYLFLAESYFDLGDVIKSDSVLKEISKLDQRRIQPPTQTHISLLKTKILIENKEYQKAISESDKAISSLLRMPETPLLLDAYTLKAQAYERLGDYESAYVITKNFAELNNAIKKRGEMYTESMNKVRFQMRSKNEQLADANLELGMVRTRNAFILALLFMAALYVLYRYRMHYLLKEEQTRNKIAKDLHDDLSATLSSISFFSEAAKRGDSDKTRDFLDRIDESAIEAKEKINDIIWAIDPDNDDWQSFLTKCKRYASEMFESKDIQYSIDIETKNDISINIEARKDLWLMFKEIVTNLVRHSEASNANVTFKSNKNVLSLIIVDDGKGFDVEKKFKGNGLKNIRNRAASINSSSILNIESKPNAGTKWELKFDY